MKLVSSVGVSFDVTGDCNHRPVLQQMHMNAVTGNTMQKASRAYWQRRSFLKKTVFISWRSNISSQRNARRRAIDAKYNKNITRLTRNHAFPRRGRRRSLGCCKRSPAISINLRRSQSVDNTCSVTRKSYIAGGPSNRPTWNSKSAWGPDLKLDKLEVTLDGWKWYL